MIRVILILFMLMQTVKADCTYTATADIVDDKLVNKVEKYVCEEEESFFVQFWTSDEWARTATMTFVFILENL